MEFTTTLSAYKIANSSNGNLTMTTNTSKDMCDFNIPIERYHCILFETAPQAMYMDRYMTPFWYFLGLVGNSIAFFIWTRRYRRHSNISSLYLAALAVTDNLLLLFHMFSELHYAWGISTLDYPIFCPIFFVLFMSLQYISPLFILGFTVERYISIVRPFRSERFSRIQRGPLEICALSFLAVALSVPQYFGWTVASGFCDGSNSEFYTAWSWGSDILVFAIFPVTTLVLNLLVLRAASKSVKFRRQPESTYCKANHVHHHHKHKTSNTLVSPSTATLLTISFYRLFTLVPVAIIFALQFTYPVGDYRMPIDEIKQSSTWRKHVQWFVAKKIIDEIGLSQYCCNIFIYLVTAKPFRMEMRRCFRCHDKGKQDIQLGSLRNENHTSTNATLLDPSLHKGM
ncbi:hypothetical protein FSP39_014479 [Pinctada imbricata]|uniref:G-protein coupled receptors family 1 profile domain-containing protein n=1 Tax=Pinctada imbricata TaxID=66713 RepID=A0AA88YF14_PINIB|nr:hypothetical protein FSP39_014479 [Pinctada imbricata]